MRAIMFLIIAIVLGLLLFHSVRIFRLVRISVELVKRSQSYERRIEAGTPRMLVIGDSTGVGTGASDPAFSIAGRFGAEFPNAFIQNESVNGWKVADALGNFPDVPAKSFDVVLLQIGANDILRGTPLPEFSATLASLFTKATEAGGSVYALHSGNIGLAPFFPWPLSHIMRSRTLLYRAEYQRIAREHGVTYINLYYEAADDPFRGKREFYADDLLHLSDAGYAEWYRTIRRMMKSEENL